MSLSIPLFGLNRLFRTRTQSSVDVQIVPIKQIQAIKGKADSCDTMSSQNTKETFLAQPMPNEISSVIQANRFATRRTLSDYRSHLGKKFFEFLLSLSERDHWIDMGAGEANAACNYLGMLEEEVPEDIDGFWRKACEEQIQNTYERLNKRPVSQRAYVTAVSYQASCSVPRRSANRHFRLMDGRFLHEIGEREIRKAKLITDLYGILPYSHNPDWVLKRYLDLLEEGGRIYLFCGRHQEGFLESSQVIGPAGPNLWKWLENIHGIKVHFDVSVGFFCCIEKTHVSPIMIPALEYVRQSILTPENVPIKVFQTV